MVLQRKTAGYCYHLVNVYSSSLSQSDRIKRLSLLLVIAQLSIQLLFRKRKLELKFFKVEDKKVEPDESETTFNCCSCCWGDISSRAVMKESLSAEMSLVELSFGKMSFEGMSFDTVSFVETSFEGMSAVCDDSSFPIEERL